MATNKPNILLIVLDALRQNHLSTYGYSRETSPHLSRFTEDGCIFKQAIATSIWTLPTFASLFTGAHTPGHNTHAKNLVLPSKLRTIADVLSSNGYSTAGLSNTPAVSAATKMDRGFKHFSLGGRINFPYFKEQLNLFQTFINKKYRRYFKYKYGKGTPWAVKEVKKWINKLGNSSSPFFIFAHFVETHLPYLPPMSFRKQFMSDAALLKEAERLDQNPTKFYVGLTSWGEKEFEILRCLYDAEITFLDQSIGKIFDYLRKIGILDKTLVIVTADHGENLGDHGQIGHQYCIYDTLLKIPLIIRYPEVWGKGKTVSDLVQNIDILPTLIDLLNIKNDDLSSQIQGISLLNPKKREFAVSEYWYPWLKSFKKYPWFDTSKLDISYTAIRKEEYKLIKASDGRRELYSLKDDPGEENNLIEREPGKVKELEALMESWLSENHLPAIPGKSEEDFDEDIKERLEALGYL